MNTLLIFFALPIAVIIISIALQKILKCPLLVAAIIFAIFLIVTFINNDLNFLIAALVYAIISFVTAIIVCFICRILERSGNNFRCGSRCTCEDKNECNNILTTNINDILTIDSDFQSDGNNGVFTINTLNSSNSNNCGCNSCNCNSNCSSNNSNNGVTARINVIPNSNTNGRTGCLCGNYRRR